MKKDIADYLPSQAWYLHTSSDGRLFYKNTQNLAAKLHSMAPSYNRCSCVKELRQYLDAMFAPILKDCHQKIALLPAIGEVRIQADNVTLNPISDQALQERRHTFQPTLFDENE